MRRPLIATFAAAGLALAAQSIAQAQDCSGAVVVCPGDAPSDGFALIDAGAPVAVRTDPADHRGLIRTAQDLREDLQRVSGNESPLNAEAAEAGAIIAGTLGRNRVIDRMVEAGALDVSGIEDRAEGHVRAVVDDPELGRVLVIAGSDMRGAIFGIYDLSREMGVSPWHWWADVPVERADDLFVTPGADADAPEVAWRGIFLNDENPALYGWVNETYGGFNHEFYEDVFELILRLRGNYLWPAMWGKAFYDDDALNPVLASEYGVVIGTSHHEPMDRAHIEWERYGQGTWDYAENPEVLRAFWRDGIERRGDFETVVTVGMRGDGDEAMAEDTATELLETIVDDQRAIIADVTDAPAEDTPQVWALYKEVQDYFDAGMRVPEDVTLLFADDNWGNIRRLPAPEDEQPGGYGVYYHFDYVGAPRNYKWLNTTQVERTWEQMNLAWEHGADQLWIVNVGDLKPMELPISFFLDQAWNPEAMTLERMSGYTRGWAAEQFGEAQAGEIGELLTRYTQYNARRKPELIGPDTFSPTDFREAERIEADWTALADRADAVREALPEEYDDAFVQLIWFPIQASANLNRLHIETGRNRLWAEQGRIAANDAARRVEDLFARDEALQRVYEQEIADGKWAHMMSQTHISYTYWQQPEDDVLPELERVEPVSGAALGLAVEGDARAWPGADGAPSLRLERHGAESRWIELFDRGEETADFTLESDADWLLVSESEGSADGVSRIEVSADWDAAPEGETQAEIAVSGDGLDQTIAVTAIDHGADIEPGRFIEADGHVTMEAAHFARAEDGEAASWIVIEELGRTLSGVTSAPSTAAPAEPGRGARLDYEVFLHDAGGIEIETTVSPTLGFKSGEGLRFAVSVGDQAPQIVRMLGRDDEPGWEDQVADSVASYVTEHEIAEPGPHTVTLWRVDPGVVFQRVSVRTSAVPETYLGPPESARAE